MTGTWPPDEQRRIGDAVELLITTYRADGTRRSAVPIWVVVADGEVFVRTWQRRETGWFGRALRSGRAHVSAGGVDSDVAIDDLGDDPAVRAAVDAAYRAKYGSGSSTARMVGDEAAATTLRLIRE